ncbi:membrane fusion protein (multidrug efflux system) [Sinorhizobium fredii]
MDENVISLNSKLDRNPGQPDLSTHSTTMDAGQPAKGAPLALTPPAQAKSRKSSGLRNSLLGVSAAAVVAAAVSYGNDYWTVGRFEVSTDDAYIKADSSVVAPKISGHLAKVLVADNETVKAGQVLATIDNRDYVTAVEQAKANVDAARASVDAKKAALKAQQSTIAAAQASVDIDRANETFAEQNDKRYSRLATTGYAPAQTAQQAASQIAAYRATTARDVASLAGAVTQIDILKAETAQAEAALARDVAVQRQAELNQSYTNIVAPIDGVVGNRTLRVGQYVQAGTQLMTVVPTTAAYIVANYKETQLQDVHPGQPVDIEVDMFPGHVYRGRVDSVAPASGQEFALLPPDNATGNFTKVVQRIPVRIVLDADSTTSGDLRPGMSVTPSINTKNGNE